MLDSYDIGLHKGHSPEAAVPLIEKIRTENRLGGAGNVGLNLKNLDLNPIIVSVVGDDVAGKKLKHLCDENGMQSELIVEADRPTTIKKRIVDKNFHQFLRIDTESRADITMVTETQISTVVAQLISESNIAGLVIQDYNKGVCTEFVIKAIQDIGRQSDIPIFVDPKHKNFSLLASYCTIFKPNIKELSSIAHRDIAADAASINAALEAHGLDSPELVFVTLGAEGVFFRKKENPPQIDIVKGLEIKDADVSGAGDTVLAVLIWGYLKKFNIHQLTNLANKAGASVCGKPGVSSILLSDVDGDKT